VSVCGISFAGIVGSNPAGGMNDSLCECCVLSGTGFSDGLITRPEKSYRVLCVWLSVIVKHREWEGPQLQGDFVPRTEKINV